MANSELQEVTIKSLSLIEFNDQLNELCNIYRTIYREYPYLYDAAQHTQTDIYNYLKAYYNHEDGRLIIASQEEKIIGMVTGIPMLADMNEPYNVVESYRNASTKPIEKYEHYFYLGDIIVVPEMRKLGIGKKLIHDIERDFADRGYPYSALIVIKNHDDHPLKPNNFYDPSLFFEKFGYKHTGDQEFFSYPTIQPNGSTELSNHVMMFMERDHI
jgi:ribosomal protein S18 acetylase RimI-like enzyme